MGREFHISNILYVPKFNYAILQLHWSVARLCKIICCCLAYRDLMKSISLYVLSPPLIVILKVGGALIVILKVGGVLSLQGNSVRFVSGEGSMLSIKDMVCAGFIRIQ